MAHAVDTIQAVSVPGRSRASGVMGREVLAPVAFILAAVISSYALSGLPNVKLLDLLVFVAAYSLGLRRGMTVAVGTWLVYATFNPWGPTHLLLMSTQLVAATGYVAAGVAMRRLLPPSRMRLRPSRATPLFIAAALVSTLLFDVLTNLYTGYHWGVIAGGSDYGRWVWTAVTNPGALFFMAVHASSNAMLFPVFGPLLIKGAERAKGRLGW
ncbi:MAG: hypothetical protein WD645_00230 [Dehalococcoidia bacterium]